MKNILSLLLVLCVVFASCKKEPQPMSREEMQRKIDSLTQVRIRESDEQAERDLQDRIKIEVKVKVDSIINARLNPPAKDNGKANTLHMPTLRGAANPIVPLPVPAKRGITPVNNSMPQR